LCAGLAATLCGCSTTPAWAPWYKAPPQAAPAAAPTPTPQEPPPRKIARHVEHHPTPDEAPEEQVAMIDPMALVGKKREDVTKLLGAPTRILKEDMSLIWSYEADGCALKVYFYPDIKTSAFHVLKFSLAAGDGKPLDADAPCRRKLLALRENDTG
jgi:hypothetical protein